MLKEESKTSVTSDWLKQNPEGLDRMVVALYDRDRSIVTSGEGDLFCSLMMDSSTDLLFFRAGAGAALARLSGLNAAKGEYRTVWSHYYQIIGKANEVIYFGEKLGLDNDVTKKAWAEAKVFRARSYFELYKRFERLYLNTVPTTVGNIERTFRPSGKEAVFSLIKDDLDDAIEALEWTSAMPGRFTKAVAKHIRAQVAMWEDDYTTAIEQCEDIFENPNYGLMDNSYECFNAADLNVKENLYVFQFSGNLGGGNSVSGGEVQGHRLAIQVTPQYFKSKGCTYSAEFGGYGWGRIYPNSYLLSLYDQEKDKRYSTLFRHKWYYNSEDGLPAGKKIGDEIVPEDGIKYVDQLHPMTVKYADFGYTNGANIERTSSYKDVVVYRLAETYLMAAEAYYHRDGGASAKAIEYYNKTWERAGNSHFDGPLTIDDILDEYARECHFEGVRWSLLKRLRMLERVRLHGGDTVADDAKLTGNATNYAQQRTNFEPKHYVWPIPQSEIDFMGVENFPQNEGWL